MKETESIKSIHCTKTTPLQDYRLSNQKRFTHIVAVCFIEPCRCPPGTCMVAEQGCKVLFNGKKSVEIHGLTKTCTSFEMDDDNDH